MTIQYSLSEVFEMAENIESNGYDFYTQAADAIKDKMVKTVFQDLARKELQHKETFASLKQELCAAAEAHWVDPDGQAAAYLKATADCHVFNIEKKVSSLLASIQSTESALRLAIGFEKDTIAFFTALKQAVTEVNRQKVDLLIKEELEHIRILQDTIKQLNSQN